MKPLGLALAVAAWAATAPPVKITNTFRYAGQGRYQWTLYVEEPRETLDRIRCVEYTLHPTYPDPVRRVCDAAGGFRLTSDGWGEFPVQVKVIWKDRHISRQQYRLDLHGKPAMPPVMRPAPEAEMAPIRTDNTARMLEGNQWEWTVFITSDEATLARVQCVQYTLHPTFPDPIQRVCDRGRGNQAFPFTARGWGTFDIPVKVEFRDGSVRELRHTLKFGASAK